MTNGFDKYYQSIKYLESILNLPIRNYLLKKNDRSFFIERLRYFLKLLGNPHRGFKFIHIAGTAGKGTTVNLIHEILNAAGCRVGSYFSPHPTTAIERIKVNDLYIGPDDFSKLIERLKPTLEICAQQSPYGHPSYFETFLALAFLYFKKQKCEYVILESGLGGLHDATNIIERPLVNIITNINYDHQDILGKSLTAIAKDKAGIIKKDSIFITTETRPPLLKIFHNQCRKKGAKFISLKTDNSDKNRILAEETALALNIDDKYVQQGLAKAKLPCRFEAIQKKPLVILDGSHNPTKMAKVAENLKKLKYRRLILILGMADDKDHQKTLEKIVPLADEVILTRFLNPYRKSADLKKLACICKKLKAKKPISCLDPWQALGYGQKIQKKDDLLLVTGSFFLTGELRTEWITEEYILKQQKSF
ncbi:hypothetical protein KJ840_00845 [Patescibacteria group bacterium]|nr:hypothetical protein [Patescibacteria group bacterium]